MSDRLDTMAALLAQADVTEELNWFDSPEPFKNRYRKIATEHPLLAERLRYTGLIAMAAESYRKAEQDGTPRMFVGRELFEIAQTLDRALEGFL